MERKETSEYMGRHLVYQRVEQVLLHSHVADRNPDVS